MTLFGWIVVGVGLLLAGWLITRLNKTSGSSAAAHHSGVGYVGLDPNNTEEAAKAHSGVGYTGVPVSVESAPELKPTVAKKAAKKAPAKKAAAKAPRKTSK
jgi:hypothetical protein